MVSSDVVEMLAARIAFVVAEPGERPKRWRNIVAGRNRSEFVRTNAKGKETVKEGVSRGWELLCDPLGLTEAEAWAALPQVRRDIDSERVSRLLALLDDLYADRSLESRLSMSRNERRERRLYDETWSYSEIHPQCFLGLLLKLRVHGHLRKPGKGVFVDCGSGFGKNVYCASMVHTWERCIGIEGLTSLANAADGLKQRFKDVVVPKLDLREPDLSFITTDFLEERLLVSATLVYADLAWLSEPQFDALQSMFVDLTHGAVVITLARPLDSDAFFLLWRDDAAQTTWGTAPVFVYERKPPHDALQ